jgi:hypothetical protein
MQPALTEYSNEQRVDKATDNKEVSPLKNLMRLIINKWWLFVLTGLVFGVGGYVYASRQQPVYESHLTFALDEGGSEGDMSGAMGIAAQFGFSIGNAKSIFTGDNILQIMKSRRIVESVLLSVDTFNNKPYTFIEYYLEKVSPAITKTIPSTIHYLPGEEKIAFSHSKDSILYSIYSQFANRFIDAYRPDKKFNIIEVKVSSLDEQFTKKFTDRLVQATNLFYTDITSKKARETLEILEARVPEMKNRVNKSIVNKAAALDANLNPAFAQAQVPIIKEQVNTEVYGTAYSEMYKNLEMARFQYLKSIPLMQIIDAADYPMQKVKVSKLKTGFTFAFAAIVIIILVLGLNSLRPGFAQIFRSN